MRKTTFQPWETYAKEESRLCQFRFLNILSMTLAILAMSTFQLSAQCTLACNDIQISVNMDCEATITTSMFGDTSECMNGDFMVNVYFDGVLIPTSPTITSEYVGERVTLELVDNISGNLCWAFGYVEDKFPPVFTPVDTTILSCGEFDSFPAPILTDNCGGDVDVFLTDEILTPLDCDSTFVAIVTRVFEAEDERGNRSVPFRQAFKLERLQEEDIVFPDSLLVRNGNPLSCTRDFDTNGNGVPDPFEINGFPTVNGVPLSPFSPFCNATVSFDDIQLPPIHCNELIMRVFTITEWLCGEPRFFRGVQLIEIADTTAPTFVCPADFTVSAGIHDCSAQVTLPPITAMDDCQDVSDIEVDIKYPGGFLNNQNGGVVELTGGVHTVEYRALDQCGNMANCFVTVTVVDDNPPVPVCDAFTVVSLTRDGTGKAFAETFDDGSTDNCENVWFKVIRMDAAGCESINGDDDDFLTGVQVYFDDYVKFCCEDVDGENVMVRFRVYDVDPGDGPVNPARHLAGGDLFGRFNECMVEVEVQDKLPPTITCPPDITVSCTLDFDTDDLSMFGTVHTDEADRVEIIIDDPAISDFPINYGLDGVTGDNCVVDIDVTVVKKINACNVGEITRLFIAEDAGGRTTSCIQRITITRVDSFDQDNIIWPLNFEARDIGCDAGTLPPDSLPPLMDRPTFIESDCDDIAVSFRDEIFTFDNSETACFKILRTWKVIDWCGSIDDGAGGVTFPQFTHTQVIKVFNDVAPTIISDCGPVQICTFDDECADGFIDLTFLAEDDCTPQDELKYSYRVDAFSDGSFDITGSGNDASGNYPVGRHTIRWTAEDGCGNEVSCTQEFAIANCKKPTPVCHGLVTVLMESTGTVEIWANDLDKGSYHVCDAIKVFVSFSPDSLVLNRTFTCDDLGDNEVMLWVIDEFGNSDFCTVTVEIQDDNNSNACDGFGDGDIMGLVTTENDEAVADVNIALEGSTLPSQMTDTDGMFAFGNMPFGGSYNVVPYNNDFPLNGISTFDIVKIQKHILDIELLDSPYKIIAADVNNSQEVTALDIIELRRLLLGYYTEFQNNTSWRFVDSRHDFRDPQDPWSTVFAENYFINPFDEDMMEADFTGVKIGDVNGSADTDGLLSTEDRTDGEMIVHIAEKKITAGEKLEIPVQILGAEAIASYQYGWNFDPQALRYEGVTSNVVSTDDTYFGTMATEAGHLSTLWYGVYEEDQLRSEDAIYTMTFTAMQDGYLSDYLQISSDLIQSEGTDRSEQLLDVTLQYRGETEELIGVVLNQNRPNPFSDKTDISFVLPQAAEATISILDVTGKIILAKTGYFDKGLNVVTIEANQLSSEGVMYYRLETEDFVQMKPMILLK